MVRLKQKPASPAHIATWYVCTYSEGDEFRAEISCPKIIEDGYFADFYERIFLTHDESGDGGIVRRADDDTDGSGFDVQVKRKQK